MTITSIYAQIPSNQDNQTILLFHAATTGQLQQVKNLISSSDLINIQDEHGNTALILAAANGHDKIVLYLLKQNADHLAVTFANGRSALVWALVNNHIKVLETLLTKYPATNRELYEHIGMHPIHLAARYGYVNTLNHYCDLYPKSINSLDMRNQTPLLYAARYGHLSIVRYLTAHELIDLELATNYFDQQQFNYMTPLLWAKANQYSANNINDKILYQDIANAIIYAGVIETLKLDSLLNLLALLINNISSRESSSIFKNMSLKSANLKQIKQLLVSESVHHIGFNQEITNKILSLIAKTCATTRSAIAFFTPTSLNEFEVWATLHIPEINLPKTPFAQQEHFTIAFNELKICLSNTKTPQKSSYRYLSLSDLGESSTASSSPISDHLSMT